MTEVLSTLSIPDVLSTLSIPDVLSAWSIPEEIRSYLAVLGLLLCWKLHGIEARRKKAVISQFYICLSRNDPATCDRCRMAHMHVFRGRMPREVGLRIHCSNRLGCRCALIPITRQWPIAKRLRRQARRKKGALPLSEQDLQALLHEDASLSDDDRLTETVVLAMLAEKTRPEAALQAYREAIAQDPEPSIALQQAAAYIGMAEILEQSGDVKEALQVTRDFLKAFSKKDRYYQLTKPQYNGMLARQKRLVRQLLQ